MNEELTVATAADMRALGRRLAAVLRAGDVVLMSGPLGAGKTTLTQGIGQGLGIRGPVTSPTFVIARVHPPRTAAWELAADGPPAGRAPAGGLARPGPALVHADAYRLGSAAELDDLDLDTDTDSSVTVVEWGEGLAEGLAEDRLEIAITLGPGDAGPGDGGLPDGDSPRTVRISGIGKRWRDIRLPPADVADRL